MYDQDFSRQYLIGDKFCLLAICESTDSLVPGDEEPKS